MLPLAARAAVVAANDLLEGLSQLAYGLTDRDKVIDRALELKAEIERLQNQVKVIYKQRTGKDLDDLIEEE